MLDLNSYNNRFEMEYEDTVTELVTERLGENCEYEIISYMPAYCFEASIVIRPHSSVKKGGKAVVSNIEAETFDVFKAVSKKTGKNVFIAYGDNDSLKILSSANMARVLKGN